MDGEGKSNSTDILLGKVIGELAGFKEQFRDQMQSQEASFNNLSNKFDDLPCDTNTQTIETLIKWKNGVKEYSSYSERSRKEKWRDLGIAVIAAIITGGFMLLGVAAANGHILAP